MKLLMIIQMKFKIIIYAIKIKFKELKSLRLKLPELLSRETKTTKTSSKWLRFKNSRHWNSPKNLRKRNRLNRNQKCRYSRRVKTMLLHFQVMRNQSSLRKRHSNLKNHLKFLKKLRNQTKTSLLMTYSGYRKIWPGLIFRLMRLLQLRKMIVMKSRTVMSSLIQLKLLQKRKVHHVILQTKRVKRVIWRNLREISNSLRAVGSALNVKTITLRAEKSAIDVKNLRQ